MILSYFLQIKLPECIVYTAFGILLPKVPRENHFKFMISNCTWHRRDISGLTWR